MNEMNVVGASLETTVQVALGRIRAALNRSVEGVLDAADCIVEYSNHKDYPKLMNELVNNKLMGKSTISQYTTIGKCVVLRKVIKNLPQSFNSLYHLAKLEREQSGFIENLISRGNLSPSTTLEELRGYGSSVKGTWTTIVIEVDSKIDVDTREKLKNEFIAITKQLGVDVKAPSTKKTIGIGGGK